MIKKISSCWRFKKSEGFVDEFKLSNIFLQEHSLVTAAKTLKQLYHHLGLGISESE